MFSTPSNCGACTTISGRAGAGNEALRGKTYAQSAVLAAPMIIDVAQKADVKLVHRSGADHLVVAQRKLLRAADGAAHRSRECSRRPARPDMDCRAGNSRR